ncbi:MAG: Stage V sporulation protein AD [Thermoanaerobacterales bacterium 50_218]|nr:MAG: Stage V sporulation protein AD [Thermoanaerobacterales bacterium 50_218]HAA90431.1 stage V sporulation protein AD [Peptococcaceae bacterium]
MGSKVGQHSISFSRPPVITVGTTIVGPIEGKGPLAQTFDWILEDLLFGEKSWEKAERKMLQESAKLALKKRNLQEQDVDFFLAGDLLNQTVSSNYAARCLGIPFWGLFGACATFVEAMLLGSMIIDGGFASKVLLAASSHHNTAERQFRFPTEQGNQRPMTSQWTVTGSGALLLEDNGEGPRITLGTVGKVVDLGISDVNNMGAAMAPAAASTLISHFQDTGTGPNSYDLILTGDLGKVGREVLKELLKKRGYLVEDNLNDCGLLIYDLEKQDMHAGGSGCGCCAVVFSGLLLSQLREKQFHKVLLVATGALMSPAIVQQGETIPGIAHAVVIESG